MTLHNSKSSTGHLASCFTVLIWGITFISTKVLLRVFTPIEILFLRFTIGYVALWFACPRLLRPAERRQEWYFAAAGLCGVTLYYLFENIALTYTLASNVGVICSIAPFFTALFSSWFLHEGRPSKRFFLGFVIAITGVGLISFNGAASLQVNPLGDGLAMIAVIIWAAYSTLAKKISAFGYPTILTTRRTFFYGLLFMIPVALGTGFEVAPVQFASGVVAGNLLFLGLGASAVCFVTWNFAVKRLGTVKTSVYIYMVPIITAVTSALVLKERMTPQIICGIVLTMAGLLMSEQRKKPAKAVA